jgi:tetratricopeptide (TPR) repeat protein
MASSILSELIKKTESTIIKQRSLACLGNIYFLQGDPKKAIQIYKPLSQNQEFIEKFPSLLFNLATAQFQSEALPESLETFVQFFKRHPDHSHGALAMLRIAELFEVFGQPRDRVFRILREAQFRYSPEPPHLGAAARMRFLSMRFPLMKSAELKSAIAEIKNLSKSLSFPNAREWMSFITSDGLVEAMDFEQALKILAQYLQNYPTTLSKARFQDKIQEVIHQKLKYLLGRKEHVQVLSTHEHHQGLWLKDKQRVDTQFLIGRAYEELGLFDQAIRFYEHLSNSQDDSRVTVSVFDSPPPQPQLQLRLGVALTYSGQSDRAIQTLSGIEAIAENLSLDEQAERAVAMVKALTDRGELNRALNFLSPLIETHPDGSLSRAQLSFQKNLLLKKTGAIGSYLQEQEALTEKLRDRSDGRDLYQQVLIETLEFLSSIESPTPTQKKLREERLSEFVAEFAKDGQFNQWRYALGFLNFENGQIEEARKNWGPLLKPDSAGDLSFWGKRAKDWLAQSDWEKEKKDLMSRIPAAQSSSEILRE